MRRVIKVDQATVVVLGDAGCGKSTLLRVIALDLLHDQQHFPELVARWGQFIPIYIPFAHWTSQVARVGNSIGIKEIVRRSLEHFVTTSIVDLLDRAINDHRVLLLVDGLDEWASEQAARTTVGTLVTTVEAHGVPIIVSGRPRGLSRIGTLPTHWKRGTVAPLSSAQQTSIATRWFERYAAATAAGIAMSESRLRTNRFMGELGRDANLGTLATVPLLLIGLVTLALRNQILPRTRNDVYDQLVRVLLEVHPESRATASGDTEDRFRHASDPTQRRAAIARLAFAMRAQAGGAGIPLIAARELLHTYLASSQGFDFAELDAAAAAHEILSVNAETQGLIIEKAPGEVGFVHASFEEFLAAEHIGGWSFTEIEDFVRVHAGEGRWRNVITNLLGRIQRRDEFDQLIAIIESPDSDEVTRYHRQFLLGDIAFSSSVRSPAAAKRLALATMSRIDTEDWLPAKREALASVLKGLTDPTLKVDIERRLHRWLPARLPAYGRIGLIQTLGSWKPTEELQDLLFQAMHDEERGVQRAAAAAYARVFSASPNAGARLLDGLVHTRNLAASAALLECLAHGWAESPDTAELFNEAWHSHGGEVRLAGILGLAMAGKAGDEARDVTLHCQGFWSGLSHPYRDLAASMLMKFWAGDENLVASALKRASRGFDSPWEYDAAIAFLLESPTDTPSVRAWILGELGREFPFNLPGERRAWSQVGRFAAADPAIRAAASAYWCNPKNRLINLHKLPGYVSWINDQPIAAVLIEVLGEKKRNFDRYWAMTSLLTGWGREHPDVKSAIDALANATDEDLDDLAAFLPEIMQDKSAARTRLICMSARPQLRRDLLIKGLAACGCDASDNQAVAAIFSVPDRLKGSFNPSYELFNTFGAHPMVREFALKSLQDGAETLMATAAGYPDDPEFAPALLDAVRPLPIELRTQIVEAAAVGASGTTLEAVLGQAAFETDSDLRARMVIAHYRLLPEDARDIARQTLAEQMFAVGGDFESVRASALAGLTVIGGLGALTTLKERDKPLELVTSTFSEGIAPVERLICENFGEFEAVFGDTLHERFNSVGLGSSRLPSILAAAPSASPAARAAFLSLAELGQIPHTPGALRALAAERPSSDLLLACCWNVLDREHQGNDSAMVNGDVGIILRDHFAGNVCVCKMLVDRYKKRPCAATAIPLAIFAPASEELPFPATHEAFGHELGGWAVTLHVAGSRADSATFCTLLEAMVTRPSYYQFDAQQITNQAVEERLLSDPELEGLMSARIDRDVELSISCSFARYLAAAGKLDPPVRRRVLDLLSALGASQRLPVEAFDVIADQWRSARAILLDAVSAGLELG